MFKRGTCETDERREMRQTRLVCLGREKRRFLSYRRMPQEIPQGRSKRRNSPARGAGRALSCFSLWTYRHDELRSEEARARRVDYGWLRLAATSPMVLTDSSRESAI